MLAHIKSGGKTIVAEPITPENFAPFGGVISSQEQLATAQSSSANYGTATKLFQVSPIECSHENAQADWNLFRCSPPVHLIEDHREVDGGLSYPCKVLERHPYSTQTFLPLGRPKQDVSYMVIVAPTDKSTPQNLPDVSKIQAFTCRGDQAVTYGLATWHAPMIALGETTDFAVLIHETGEAHLDCEEVSIENATIEFALSIDTGEEKSMKRKPQTKDEFEEQRKQYAAERLPITAASGSTGDQSFDMKQVKYAVEREYYHKNWQKVIELVNSSDTNHKKGGELLKIKQRAEQKLAAEEK